MADSLASKRLRVLTSHLFANADAAVENSVAPRTTAAAAANEPAAYTPVPHHLTDDEHLRLVLVGAPGVGKGKDECGI